jgi:hypothetical protein
MVAPAGPRSVGVAGRSFWWSRREALASLAFPVTLGCALDFKPEKYRYIHIHHGRV